MSRHGKHDHKKAAKKPRSPKAVKAKASEDIPLPPAPDPGPKTVQPPRSNECLLSLAKAKAATDLVKDIKKVEKAEIPPASIPKPPASYSPPVHQEDDSEPWGIYIILAIAFVAFVVIIFCHGCHRG